MWCQKRKQCFSSLSEKFTTLQHSAITCSKLTIETLEEGVKYVQSLQ